MTWYVGLTDEPKRRRADHGNPPDWQHRGPFANEAEARAWEAEQLERPNCLGGTGGAGWHYGYWYTITPSTLQ